MLKAIIEHQNNTLLLEFPCKRMLLAEHLASIGIRTAPHEIKCIDEEDAPIKVKIYGESEFDAKLASVVSPENTLSGVNSFCEIYHNMPYANKLDIQKVVLNGEVSSLREFGQLMLNRRQQDIDKDGYVIADMYDPANVSVFKVWDGAKYEIRDYLVTVNKTEHRNFEIEVHGLLKQED